MRCARALLPHFTDISLQFGIAVDAHLALNFRVELFTGLDLRGFSPTSDSRAGRSPD